MGLTVGGTSQNYSSTGANNVAKYIPQIWSKKMLISFYDATVFGEIANTDYEGEIQGEGDSVIIRTRPTITINTYVKGAGLTYEDPESANVQLDIDQAKYFAFSAYDTDRAQSDLNYVDEFSNDGAEQMKISIDTGILGAIYADAHASNKGATAGAVSGDINLGVAATPVAVTKTNILDLLVDYGTVLDEQSAPEAGRFVVMPAKMCGLVKKSDLKDASLAGDGTSIMRNGRLGMIDRFTIYSSNNINVAGGEYDVIFGQKAALTFASQMDKFEEVRNTTDFGDYIRSLNVYGYEVIKPEALGHSVVSL